MGHHYRHQCTLAIGDLAEHIAIWEMHLTAPATSKPIFVWSFELSLASNVAAAGAMAFRLQREATIVHAAGTAESVAAVSRGAPTSGATITRTNTGLATAATDASGFASFLIGSTVAGGSQFFSLTPARGADDLWTPICVITGVEQLILATDVDIPAAMNGFVSLSIQWEEI